MRITARHRGADRLKPTSFGLRGMEERAAQLGGTVNVSPLRPSGTCIAVSVPHANGGPDSSDTTRIT